MISKRGSLLVSVEGSEYQPPQNPTVVVPQKKAYAFFATLEKRTVIEVISLDSGLCNEECCECFFDAKSKS